MCRITVNSGWYLKKMIKRSYSGQFEGEKSYNRKDGVNIVQPLIVQGGTN